jgi:hypothetical protein
MPKSTDLYNKRVPHDYASHVKDAGKGETVLGKPLKRVSEHKVKDVIGKADRNQGRGEVEQMVSIMEKEGVPRTPAMAQVFDKSLAMPEFGDGKRPHHGIIKG